MTDFDPREKHVILSTVAIIFDQLGPSSQVDVIGALAKKLKLDHRVVFSEINRYIELRSDGAYRRHYTDSDIAPDRISRAKERLFPYEKARDDQG